MDDDWVTTYTADWAVSVHQGSLFNHPTESPGEKKIIGEQNASGVSRLGGGAAVRPDNSQRVFNLHTPGPWGILTPGCC